MGCACVQHMGVLELWLMLVLKTRPTQVLEVKKKTVPNTCPVSGSLFDFTKFSVWVQSGPTTCSDPLSTLHHSSVILLWLLLVSDTIPGVEDQLEEVQLNPWDITPVLLTCTTSWWAES